MFLAEIALSSYSVFSFNFSLGLVSNDIIKSSPAFVTLNNLSLKISLSFTVASIGSSVPTKFIKSSLLDKKALSIYFNFNF